MSHSDTPADTPGLRAPRWHTVFRVWGDAVIGGLMAFILLGLWVLRMGPAVTTAAGQLVGSALSETVFGIAAAWAWARHRQTLEPVVTPWRWRWWGGGCAAGLALAGAMSLGTSVVTSLHGHVPSNSAAVFHGIPPFSGAWWGVVGVAVVLAPVMEELFFRGILQPSLSAAAGPVVGIGMTSMLFAVLHQPEATGPSAAWLWLMILPGGLLNGWLRWRTGHLSASIGAHMAFNAVAVLELLR